MRHLRRALARPCARCGCWPRSRARATAGHGHKLAFDRHCDHNLRYSSNPALRWMYRPNPCPSHVPGATSSRWRRYVAWCMQVAGRMPHPICRLGACYRLHVACMLHVACGAWYMMHVACCTYATCHISHVAWMLHVACHMVHVAFMLHVHIVAAVPPPPVPCNTLTFFFIITY